MKFLREDPSLQLRSEDFVTGNERFQAGLETICILSPSTTIVYVIAKWPMVPVHDLQGSLIIW